MSHIFLAVQQLVLKLSAVAVAPNLLLSLKWVESHTAEMPAHFVVSTSQHSTWLHLSFLHWILAASAFFFIPLSQVMSHIFFAVQHLVLKSSAVAATASL